MDAIEQENVLNKLLIFRLTEDVDSKEVSFYF